MTLMASSMLSDLLATVAGPTATGAPKTRVDVLRVIAERYHELVDPLNAAAGVRGDGDSVALMPKTYTATVREFERLSAVMRYDRHRSLVTVRGEKHSIRQLRWHLMEFHVNATRTVRHVPIELKRTKGRAKLALLRDQDGQPITTRPIIRVHRLPAAREHLAEAALEWMAVNWALKSEPMLPGELLAAP